MLLVVDNNDGTYTCEVPDGKYEYIVSKEGYFQNEGTVEVDGVNVDVFVELEEDFSYCANLLGSGSLSGTDITWKICSDTETLFIFGTGVIPDNISGEWKSYDDSFINLVIENGITTIGDYAFSGCFNLVKVNIPDSVTSIGNSAFHNCNSLSEIIIPEFVTTIGHYAFQYCHGLITLNIPNSITSIGIGVFCDCSNLLEITIPHGITIIGNSTFYGCTSLVNVNIPDSVTHIGESAFDNCVSLIEIVIPYLVTFEYGIFYNCISLSKITNYALTPQPIQIGDDIFLNVDTSTCVLEVPSESLSLYQTAEVWEDFQNIVGI